MIEVSLPGKTSRKVLLNPHLIEYAEEAGEGRTALLLTTGKRFVVTESSDEVREMIIAYRREIGFPGQEE
ncbi:MAG: flagellar FlbD family protein [Spirochaetaceae bacterium]|nr:flagellar FlbD family protein [Spirochaetaceae bacterium]